MFFREKQKSSQRKIHKSPAKQFIEIPLNKKDMEFIKYNLEEIVLAIIIVAFLFVIFYVLKSKKRRRKVGFYINFILYKLGIKSHISRTYIGMSHVKECYEPLVDIVAHPKILYNETTIEKPVLLRREVANKLYKIADKLPDDIYIKIYSAYRSRMILEKLWKEEVDRITKENPEMYRGEVLELAKFKVTAPDTNMGGHDTGAAIDIALCDRNGKDLDFGTRYHENSQAKSTVVLNAEQKQNRGYLLKLMKSQGFVQQPSQWWHYSYGDRYWATYKGRRHGAIYGSAEKEFENTGYQRVIKTIISSVNK